MLIFDKDGFESAPSGIGYIGYPEKENVVEPKIETVIQKWEQIIDAGKVASWTSVNIEEEKPEGTTIKYSFSTSNTQVEWSEPVEDVSKVPEGRFLKITIETRRPSNLEVSPEVRNISVDYNVGGKTQQTAPLTRHNRKINFSSYNQIIYVDAFNGDDTNDGSINKPYKDINTAYRNAINGTLLCLKEGTYTFTTGTMNKEVDFYGQNEKTIFIFKGPYQRPFNVIYQEVSFL